MLFARIELSSLLLSLPSPERECKLVTPITLSPSLVRSHVERHGLEMGSGGSVSIQFTQGTDYNGSNSHPARQLVTFSDQRDSSDFATGAVLSQQSPEDNKWHPVAFLSKSLSPVEQN